MDIQVNTNDFQNFLKMCACNELIKDLVVQADENGLHARFCTKEKTMYGEVHLKDITLNSSGVLKAPRLKQLSATVGRVNSDIFRIVTKEPADGSTPMVCITDGVGMNNVKTNLLQAGDAVIVESYDSLNHNKVMFDPKTLYYIIFDGSYENGCRVDTDMLAEVLKDAKAFDSETYKFTVKTVKKKDQELKTFLVCSIVNDMTQESMTRTIADGNFIGDPTKIPEVYVGGGFRQIITGILSSIKKSDDTQKPVLNIYFNEMSILVTDGKSFFFNLHTLE